VYQLCSVLTHGTHIRGMTLCLESFSVDTRMAFRSVSGSPPNDFRGPRAEGARRSRARVRSWAGRSAMLGSTDNPTTGSATAGARKTRVSEMRPLLRDRRLRLNVESTASAPVTPECRNRGVPEHQHRWSG
jgi:hypothetical protein